MNYIETDLLPDETLREWKQRHAPQLTRPTRVRTAMKTLAVILLVLALGLLAASAASASPTQLSEAPREAPLGLDRKCPNVRDGGLRYFNIRTRKMSCRFARRYVTGYDRRGRQVRLPAVYDVSYAALSDRRVTAFRFYVTRPAKALAFSVR